MLDSGDLILDAAFRILDFEK